MINAVSLKKGGNVSLSKQAPGLKMIAIGLGWDVRQSSGAAFDLDASAFMLTDKGKLLTAQHLIYFGNLKSPDGSVVHQGDNLTGAGEGDDEVINVILDKIPATVQKILFTVNIYQAEARQQNFGMVQNAFIRVVNLETPSSPPPEAKPQGVFGKLFGGSSTPTSKTVSGQELTRYDLAEEFGLETSLIFGELYRYNDEWKFRAVGQGFKGGLAEMKKFYS